MLVGVLAAQDSSFGESRLPKPVKQFDLTYWDIRQLIHKQYPEGRITVTFDVTKNGKVENPVIIDTFDVTLNAVILDKVRQTQYLPALQNGIPVRVRYQLPIQFK